MTSKLGKHVGSFDEAKRGGSLPCCLRECGMLRPIVFFPLIVPLQTGRNIALLFFNVKFLQGQNWARTFCKTLFTNCSQHLTRTEKRDPSHGMSQ